MTAPAPGRTADNARCGEDEVKEALALRDELMAYAAQLIRMSTQAGLGGRDLSVRVKEPEHLAHLITRAASAIQARKWVAAEAEAASLRSQLQEAQKAGEAMRGRCMEVVQAVYDGWARNNPEEKWPCVALSNVMVQIRQIPPQIKEAGDGR